MGSGVRITGPINQYPAGAYPTHIAERGQGGHQSVADATARNAIPSYLRELGMFVSLADLTVWQLNTITNTGTNADWTQFTGGGGGGSGSRTFGFRFALNSDAVVATDISDARTIINAAGTFTQWDIAAKVPPVGASLVVDILLSSDSGSTWTSLWSSNPGNRPTLATTVAQATGTAFDTTAFVSGNLLRIDVITIGSGTAGSGVSVEILGTLS